MKIKRLFFIALLVPLSFSCVTPTETTSVKISEMQEKDPETVTAVTSQIDSTPVPDASEEKTAAAEDLTAEVLPQLPPLSPVSLRRTIQEMMPWNINAVMDGNAPLLIIHDLDKNGYDDALVVAVEGDDNAENRLEEFSRTARLFQSGNEYSNFLLLIFYQYSGDVVLRYTVPVSRKMVFTGVNPVEIKKGSDFPYALEFSFRTRAGIENELVILSGYGITRFTVFENLSQITLVEDIDEDGYQDIIIHEQGFEEGTGFETFLTWYKWNLREYTEYRSTNIVRNLREFYIVSAEYLRSGEYAGFMEYALDSNTLSELKKQGLSDADILGKIFRPADILPEEDDFFNAGGFSAVVFPEIMETPFSYANRNDFSHKVSVRFRNRDGESRIFVAELNMKKNPFQNRQFFFGIESLR